MVNKMLPPISELNRLTLKPHHIPRKGRSAARISFRVNTDYDTDNIIGSITDQDQIKYKVNRIKLLPRR